MNSLKKKLIGLLKDPGECAALLIALFMGAIYFIGFALSFWGTFFN